MAGNNMVELNDTNFEQEVLKSDQPVLVDFWATWCAPCRMMTPTVESIASEYAGRAKVGCIGCKLPAAGYVCPKAAVAAVLCPPRVGRRRESLGHDHDVADVEGSTAG